MLWTFVPDSTHRYLLLVCVNSLPKHSTFINIVIYYMYKTGFTNECCTPESTESVSPFSNRFASIFLQFPCPYHPLSYRARVDKNPTWSHQGANTLEWRQCKCVWNFSICSEHGCTFRSCLKMRCLVWIDHVSRVAWWCLTVYSLLGGSGFDVQAL